MNRRVRPGRHAPLGATFDGHGVNFAVYSEHATAMEVCIFSGDREERIPLRDRTAHVFHGYVPGLGPGVRYGFRAHGPYEPHHGHWFNPNKLLVDPYARALEGKVDYRAPVFGYEGSPHPGFAGTKAAPSLERMDARDDAAAVPKSIVLADDFDWGDDRPPRVPWSDTVLYEAHVKGLTALHPLVPEEWRGTYLGLASEPVIRHLRELGVTAVELLPIHEACDEWAIAARGKVNYWGYSTLGFFAPDQRFSSVRGAQVSEFKRMVRALHAAGIEVILDVVYNHTCEGDQEGPTLCFRGLDNATYYRLKDEDRLSYEDYTGCGNTLDTTHPQVLKLVMDSLRYWVTEMHVDGFRFDLAATLARGPHRSVDKLSAFFDIVHQDPILSDVKLIAEPWDLGQGGYQVGNFPVLWAEWNGRYRDTVRRFWRSDASVLPELGSRLTGSSDLYELGGRRPHASINFVTAHDGFTLADLVSYEQKRNEDNGEDNRDGTSDNASWNMGVEGPSDDPAIVERRIRQRRNFVATLFLSQGVPMLSLGTEFGQTQGGNNNAFAQDSEVSWVHWNDEPFLAFCRRISELRRKHPVFRRARFLKGERTAKSALPDILWFRTDGREMREDDWKIPERPFVAFVLSGDALDVRDDEGKDVVDDTFLVVMNASREPVTFQMPLAERRARWELVVDTNAPEPFASCVSADEKVELPELSLRLYRLT